MKVLHFALSDYGGAGTAAVRLHVGMAAAGVDSRLLVLRKSRADIDGVIAVPAFNRLAYDFNSRVADRWVKRGARRLPRSKYFYADFNHGLLSPNLIETVAFRPDFLIAHSVSGYVPAELLGRISREWRIPALWYFMDMGALTGGCHFAFDCNAYLSRCGGCPAIGSTAEADWSRTMWLRRHNAIESSHIVGVAPNCWVERQARASGLFRNRQISKIELSIDLEKYASPDRKAARRSLGIPEEGQAIFFGAHFAAEERKGLRYLAEALKVLQHSRKKSGGQPYLITAGSENAAHSFEFPFSRYHIGYLNAQTTLPLAYGAADVFVSPAIEDSGPMMILESLSCGTPVVSFDMGVARDVLEDGRTGYVAALRDVSGLAAGIAAVLDMAPGRYQEMRIRCRQMAEKRFAPHVQASAFIDLMRSLKPVTQNLESV